MDSGDQVPPTVPPDRTAPPPGPSVPASDPATPLDAEAPPDPSAPLGPATAQLWPPYESRPPATPRVGERGLRIWLAIALASGVAGILLAQAELAIFAMLGGLFAVSQARDLDERWADLYDVLHWLMPVGAGAVFFVMAIGLTNMGDPTPLHYAFAAFSIVSGGISVALLYPPWVDRVARWWFRGSTSHTLHLATRLVVAGILLAPPGWLLFESNRELLFTDDGLVGTSELWGGLVGLILVSLGGIGFLVRRNAREAAVRLGLRPFVLSDLIVVVLGVVALFGINLGLERVQLAWFPSTHASDQEVTRLIAGDLSGSDALLLGFSAGVGEEIALRGALLPRLGLFWTSILFAALHVQYSWFGMLAILALGLLLGFIRQRTSTTTVMAIHAIYDILAVIGAQQSVT